MLCHGDALRTYTETKSSPLRALAPFISVKSTCQAIAAVSGTEGSFTDFWKRREPNTCFKLLVDCNDDTNNLVINPAAYSSTGPLAIYTSIAESGGTAHFVAVNALIINKTIAVVPIAIYNPNSTIVYSTHTVEIDVPHFLQSTYCCHIVPSLSAFLLISNGQWHDANLTVLFLTNTISMGYKNTFLVKGAWVRATGLWYFDLSNPTFLAWITSHHHDLAATINRLWARGWKIGSTFEEAHCNSYNAADTHLLWLYEQQEHV
jgi:hypothetical protein